jgi:hypothetical protein
MARKSKPKRKVAKVKARTAKKARPTKLERNLEEGLRETFPGSDAVAITDPVRTIKE